MRRFRDAFVAVTVVGLACLGCNSGLVEALELDLGSTVSIKAAARDVAEGMLNYYVGNQTGQTPGLLPAPYYWWEAGAMFGGLVEYWYYTGDTAFNDLVQQALLFQAAPTKDYMPVNQTKSEGNDDQIFWAFAAMSAAETNFPNPPPDQPQWLALAQAVFNEQAGRWDTQYCNGGLRWQIYPFNNGWKYKNSISNGGFFQLAARLARYTRNQTYADWAEKVYDWMDQSTLMNTSTPMYEVYDGAPTDNNCSEAEVVKVQWTYNHGTMINGCAYMYNYTNGSKLWTDRLDGFVDGSSIYFPDGQNVMEETAMQTCQERNSCTADQPSYKAYLSRWLATATQMAPYTYDRIITRLQNSAKGAAQQCSGHNSNICGRNWTSSNWDGYSGVGEQMSALSVIQANLISKVAAPVSSKTGGTSKGDPNAGTANAGNKLPAMYTQPIAITDRVVGWVVTSAIVVSLCGGSILIGYGDD